MTIKETGMFCLNATCTRQGDTTQGPAIGIDPREELTGAAVIVRVDNFELSAEQAVKLKEIHERAAAAVRETLEW